MARQSAGILMYRRREGRLEFLLVHPGGPFWRNKDEGAWTIPKGEIAVGESPLETARREFEEETGVRLVGEFIALQSITQKAGKIVHAWAAEGDLDPAAIRSNTFKMEWPPGSRKYAEFPEIDRAEFFDLEAARKKINPAQVAFIDELPRLVRQ